MKKFVLLLCLSLLGACVSSNAQQHNLGPIEPAVLLAEHRAFAEEYDAYIPAESAKNVVSALQGKRLIVIFGTWCHDSQREVARLLKILDVANMPVEIDLLAVDRNKQDPDGIAERMGLVYTPTIYVYSGNKELGRIIERPTVSLEQDLAEILRRE